MLMVLPSGMEKLATPLEAPRRRTDCKLVGRAAALEHVVKAMSHGSKIPRKNVGSGIRTTYLTSDCSR